MKVEDAIHLLERAEETGAFVTAILATDAAQSERSLTFAFTPEESAELFRTARMLLQRRPTAEG